MVLLLHLSMVKAKMFVSYVVVTLYPTEKETGKYFFCLM